MIDSRHYYSLNRKIKALERKKNKTLEELLELMKLREIIDGDSKADKKIKNKNKRSRYKND